VIVVVDYGMGNLGSIANMLTRIGATVTISSDPAVIETATKLILPGVGAFENGMRNLGDRGLVPVLHRRVLEQRVPILGLCLGLQLFTRRSEEGTLPGLGWIATDTVRFGGERLGAGMKVPHMGWNLLRPARPHPLFDGLDSDARFYFVHSYHLAAAPDGADTMGTTTYGYEFASAAGRDNIMGVQCHPEKSHRFGMTLFRNFVERVQR
jgi:imidazole glycerol-phosphate synthase subunit HisH